jgi:hypothetical protein
MIARVGIFGGVLLAIATVASPAPPRIEYDRLLERVSGPVGKAWFQLDIREATTAPPGVPVREVDIRCTEGCGTPVTYSEGLSDAPISAFRLWEGTSRFVTIWAGGAAYWVMIYDVSPVGVRKVMAEATRGWPQFVYLPDGSEGIILQVEADAPWKGHHMPLRSVVWKWDGRNYVTIPNGR